jgi:hypothetical protein
MRLPLRRKTGIKVAIVNFDDNKKEHNFHNTEE